MQFLEEPRSNITIPKRENNRYKLATKMKSENNSINKNKVAKINDFL